MSYNIEFRRRAFRAGENRYNRPAFIAVAETGSNNLIDAISGKVTREWWVVDFGSMSGLITGEVMDLARHTEGGMLKYRNGGTKPENYIANWRKTLTNGVGSFEDFRRTFPGARGFVRFLKSAVDDLEDRDAELYERLGEDEEWRVEEESSLTGKELINFYRLLLHPEDVEELMEIRRLTPDRTVGIEI